ncbi:MAG: hypothetical protein P4L90_16155, partial [Rhodopila sp.]|nr:hypothetical protein [Rhodopila sp.]
DSSIPGETVFGDPREDGSIPVWVDFGGVVPEQYRDERGRLLPCIEYEFCKWGWPRVHVIRHGKRTPLEG